MFFVVVVVVVVVGVGVGVVGCYCCNDENCDRMNILFSNYGTVQCRLRNSLLVLSSTYYEYSVLSRMAVMDCWWEKSMQK